MFFTINENIKSALRSYILLANGGYNFFNPIFSLNDRSNIAILELDVGKEDTQTHDIRSQLMFSMANLGQKQVGLRILPRNILSYKAALDMIKY